MKRVLLFLLCLLLFCACNTTPQTKEQAMKSFSEFIVKFCSDKDFQMAHVRFPLGTVSGMITDEDIRTGDRTDVEFGKELWLYLDASDFQVDTREYEGEQAEQGGFRCVSPTHVEFMRKGLIVEFLRSYTFEYVDGDWYVTGADFHNSGVDTYEDCVREFARINAEKELSTPSVEDFDFSEF